MKALRKPSAERYTTAAELAQEVQSYLADEPVQAYRRALDQPRLTLGAAP